MRGLITANFKVLETYSNDNAKLIIVMLHKFHVKVLNLEYDFDNEYVLTLVVEPR